ncbi:hypothetical protein FT638_28730 [Bacillus cereus]|nr:hypothetical protein [Bacillus cereus]
MNRLENSYFKNGSCFVFYAVIAFIQFMVLMQELKDNCNESINLGHTVTIPLERVRDWYGKGKWIQMEALSA